MAGIASAGFGIGCKASTRSPGAWSAKTLRFKGTTTTIDMVAALSRADVVFPYWSA
jgi:hypothetical protein